MTKDEALKLAVDGLERILGSFEKDGKVVMKSMIRNELFAEMHLLLRKSKKVLAQPEQEPPSEWAGIKAILDEYGLQSVDFVADFKAALEKNNA